MKVRFQIFKAPFYFVGWLAPAYGKDEVNPNGITKEKGVLNMKVRFQIFKAPAFPWKTLNQNRVTRYMRYIW